MNFHEYQKLASRTEKELPTILLRVNHAALGLSSETGELNGTIKRAIVYGQVLDVSNVEEELGDILWYMALLCNALNLNMSVIAMDNIIKLQKRYPEKYNDTLAEERLDKK